MDEDNSGGLQFLHHNYTLDMSNLGEDLIERLQDKFHKTALRITAGSLLGELVAEGTENERTHKNVLKDEDWLGIKYEHSGVILN